MADAPAPRRSYVDRVNASRSIHRLAATDATGRRATYFVLVSPHRAPLFQQALKGSGTLQLEDYGTVVASCYGETPTEEVCDLLEQRYGYRVRD